MKYLVMWKDSAGLPRAWGYCRDKKTAKGQAAREKTAYERERNITLLTEEVKEVREDK